MDWPSFIKLRWFQQRIVIVCKWVSIESGYEILAEVEKSFKKHGWAYHFIEEFEERNLKEEMIAFE